MTRARRRGSGLPVPPGGEAAGFSQKLGMASIAAGLFSVLVGCLVILGWEFDVEPLKRVFPRLDAMNPTTAATLILAGTSLLLSQERTNGRLRLAGRVLAAIVAVAGAIRLVDILSGWDVGVDRLIFAQKLEQGAAMAGDISRMGFNPALNFVLVGCALLLLDTRTRRGRRPAQVLSLVTMAMCLLPLIGYVYGITTFRELPVAWFFVQMAFNTALVFVALSGGILCARPGRGIMGLIASDTVGGIVARRLLPVAILLPILMEQMSLAVQRAGLGAEFAGALFVVAYIVIAVALIGWYGVLLRRQDSDRRRVEAELRRSEGFHRAVARNLPGTVVTLFDLDLRYQLVEGPALEDVGWKREDLEGKTPAEFMPPERLASVEPLYRAALAGETVSFEMPSQNAPDVHFAVQVAPVRDAEGRITGGIVAARDISERKRFEADLRESEERYRLVARATNEAIWDSDLPTDRQVWNGAVEEMFGFPARQVTDTAWWEEHVHPDDAERVGASIGAVLEGGGETWTEGYRFRRADGTYADVVDRAWVVRDGGGVPVRVVGSMMDVSERERAWRALEKSETRNRSIVQTASDAIVTMGDDGLIRSFNGGAEGIFGYSAEEAIGQPLKLLMPRRLREMHEEGLRRYLGGGEARVVGKGAVELAGRRKNGEEFPLELSLGEVRADAEVLFTGILRDITERKRAEGELREAEERFRRAFGDAPIGMALVGLDGSWIQVNRSLCAIVGYPERELLGKTFQDITHPEDLEADLEQVRMLVEGEIPSYQMEKRYFRGDGRQVWVMLSVSLATGANGEPLYFVSQIEDITERKRAEERLRESEERFRMMVDGVSDYAIFMLDSEGNVTTWNAGAERNNGYRSEEIIGEHFSRFYTREDVERGHPQEELRVAASTGRYEEEGLRVRKDGSRFWADVLITALRDEGGNLRGFSKIVHDITERKEAEEELGRLNEDLVARNEDLAQKNEEIESFVYSVSHDLRSPLVNLEGFSRELELSAAEVRALLDDDAVPEDVRRRVLELTDEDIVTSVRFIRSGVGRLSGIMDALLRLSRAGRVEYRWQEVDPNPVIGRVVEAMGDTISGAGARVEVAEDMPPVRSDPTALGQIFDNLIGNAVKYLDPSRPGLVEVGYEEGEDGFDTYFVRDNGRGIPESARHRVFRIFQRMHPDVEGEGVGLALVQRMVQRHGGRLRVESTDGEGSTFYLDLPSPGEREDR